MLPDASDIEMWSRLQAGDSEVLHDIYDKYYLCLVNYGLRLTADRNLTQDCITQVLLLLWDKRATLPVVNNHRAYLITCLRHEIYAVIESEARRRNHMAAFQHCHKWEELSCEEYLIQEQTGLYNQDRLQKALKKLTERERELLRLKFFEDLNYEEISLRCGITKRTAYNIVYNALSSLKAAFQATPGNSYVPDPNFLAVLLILLANL